MNTLVNRTILTLTTLGLSSIASGLTIDELAIGTSTDEPSESDTALQKEVARYPALATTANGKTKIRSAIEYGSLIGVHEIGLYSKGNLLATINKEISRADNNALILAKYKNIYLLDIEIDNADKSINLSVDERNDINYMIAAALLKLNTNSNSGGNALTDAPTRVGQVLTSKVVDGKLVAAWDDLANMPQTSSEFVTPPNNGDTGTDTTGLFTGLINATYTAIDKYDPNNHLTPKDTLKPYGGDLSLGENGFVFQFNSQNDSITFKTSTGVDIVFKNNFDGTIAVTDGSQELVTLNYKENGTIYLNNGSDLSDVSIAYEDPNGMTGIKPWGTELAGGRRFTSITIIGSAATIFHAQSNG